MPPRGCDGGGSPADLALTAINRRGRSVSLRISVTPLMSVSEHLNGALILMEQTEGSADGR